MFAPLMDALSEGNRLRYARGAAGHVESHFLKANSPDGERALWIKHTLLVPRADAGTAVAEVWAVAFAERGARKLAVKRSFPLGELQELAPFGWRVSCAELAGTRARGELDGLAWELELEPQAPP